MKKNLKYRTIWALSYYRFNLKRIKLIRQGWCFCSDSYYIFNILYWQRMVSRKPDPKPDLNDLDILAGR